MKTRDLDNLLISLGDLSRPEGVAFTYHRDEYALLLLAWALGQPGKVGDLELGPFARLLKKPVMRAALAASRNGWLAPEDLVGTNLSGQRYVVTLGRWGDPEGDPFDAQMTRRGENLVVQLNFPDWHDAEYRRLLDPERVQPFASLSHPVSKHRHTLAWARVDLDLQHRHALVEEIQTDWVREALDVYGDAKSTDAPTVEYCGLRMGRAAVIEYVDTVLRPHVRLWAEATLCVTLWVLLERLGIREVWFHTFEGSRLKGDDCAPPRSIYTDLPRKFCFSQTREAPGFLHWKDSPALKQGLGPGASRPVDWYRLAL
jgi:hypothetical protein